MISYAENNQRFNYRIVGVCIAHGRVLLHKLAGDDHWSLPGGRGELLEYSPDTLRREMKEELDVDVSVGRLLWVCENFFELNDQRWHEVSLFYVFDFPDNHQYYTEDTFDGVEGGTRLIFQWHPIATLMNLRLFPSFLRKSLQNLPEVPAHVLHRDIDDAQS